MAIFCFILLSALQAHWINLVISGLLFPQGLGANHPHWLESTWPFICIPGSTFFILQTPAEVVLPCIKDLSGHPLLHGSLVLGSLYTTFPSLSREPFACLHAYLQFSRNCSASLLIHHPLYFQGSTASW